MRRDELETNISQTAADRVDGFWSVYTNDPYWLSRLRTKGELVRECHGGGAIFRINHRQVSLRSPKVKKDGEIEEGDMDEETEQDKSDQQDA